MTLPSLPQPPQPKAENGADDEDEDWRPAGGDRKSVLHVELATWPWLSFIAAYTGWWFGTFFIFPYIGFLIIPTDFHIFQRGWKHQPVYQRVRKWQNDWNWQTMKKLNGWQGSAYPICQCRFYMCVCQKVCRIGWWLSSDIQFWVLREVKLSSWKLLWREPMMPTYCCLLLLGLLKSKRGAVICHAASRIRGTLFRHIPSCPLFWFGQCLYEPKIHMEDSALETLELALNQPLVICGLTPV